MPTFRSGFEVKEHVKGFVATELGCFEGCNFDMATENIG